MKQNSKTVLMNASANTTGVSTLTASVDTKGFGYARILCLVNNTVSLGTVVTNNSLEEGDDTSTFSAVTAAAPGTGWTPGTVTASSVTTLAKLAYNVDLRGRKRYLKVTLGLAATSAGVFITADLSNPGDGCGTASEQGAAVSVQI
jgi:hypothetical protein